jgi:NADH-ubiquinone oxidoreductase chain 5
MLLTIIILPLLGAIISGFLGFFVGNRGSKLITTTFILVATILSYRLFYLVALNQDTHYIKLGN